MKNAFSFVYAALFGTLTACAFSQSPFPVKGNGNVVSRDFPVSGFSAVEVSSGIDITLAQSNTENLTITADENLFDVIKEEVNGGVLKIYCDHNITHSKALRARIVFKNLESIKVSGGGDVKAETPVNTDALTIGISGGGDLNMTANANDLKCTMNGGGDAILNGAIKQMNALLSGGGDLVSDVSANDITCTLSGGGDLKLTGKEKTASAHITISGGGDLKLTIDADNLDCTVSGGGDATLSGKAANFNMNINGGGDVNAKEMLTEITHFTASGGSEIYVNASKELRGRSSGGGDVHYSGNPGMVDIDAKGGSKVYKD